MLHHEIKTSLITRIGMLTYCLLQHRYTHFLHRYDFFMKKRAAASQPQE